MATHSSVLAWRIPGTGEPGGLPSMGSQSRTRLKRLSSTSKEGEEVDLDPCFAPDFWYNFRKSTCLLAHVSRLLESELGYQMLLNF